MVDFWNKVEEMCFFIFFLCYVVLMVVDICLDLSLSLFYDKNMIVLLLLLLLEEFFIWFFILLI